MSITKLCASRLLSSSVVQPTGPTGINPLTQTAHNLGMGILLGSSKEACDNHAKLIDKALEALSKEPDNISKILNSYTQLTQEDRVIIFKKCLNFHIYGSLSMKFLRSFDEFQITSEKKRFELAKLISQEYPGTTCHSIKKFQITNEEWRFELAKIFAKTASATLCENIDDYEISDEAKRIELIDLLLQTKDTKVINSLIENIDKFKISCDHKRYEIAQKILPIISTYNFCQIIKKLQIVSEQYLIKLANIIAENNPRELNYCFDKFNITSSQSEPDRIELATIVASKLSIIDGFDIRKFAIKNLVEIQKILNIVFERARFRPSKDIIDLVEIHSSYILSIFDAPDLINKWMNTNSTPILPEPLKECKKQIIDAMNAVAKFNLNADRKVIVEFMIQQCARWYICQPNKTSLTALLPYIKEISEIHWPHLRNQLLVKLFYAPSNKQEQAQTKENASQAQVKDHIILFQLLLKQLDINASISVQEWDAIYKHLSFQEYSQGKKKAIVVRGLLALLDNQKLSASEKSVLLKHIFLQKTTDKTAEIRYVVEQFQILEAILLSEGITILHQQMNQKLPLDLYKILKSFFNTALGLPSTPEFQAKYAKTIEKGRNPLALLIYTSKIRSLDEFQRKEFLSLLKEFTCAVSEGTYKNWRYDLAKNKHLAKINEVRPDLLKIWQAGASAKIEEVIKFGNQADAKQQFDLTTELRLRIVEKKHLDPQKFALFFQCLNPQNLKESQTRETALKTLSERMSKMTKESRPPQGEKFNVEKTQYHSYFFNKLECELIRLLAPNLSIKQQLHQITHLLVLAKSLFDENSEFVKDLKFFCDYLTKESILSISKNYSVQDTDASDDLLLIGSEVPGSCQAIDWDPELNKCLIGFIADGKYRAVVLKDSQGHIAARRIMRLLWDEASQQPVLYQEKLYTNPGVPQEALSGIDKFFIERAKELKVDLVGVVDSYPPIPKYHKPLRSLGSPAPAIYVDANRLGIQDGTYRISADTANLLYCAPFRF